MKTALLLGWATILAIVPFLAIGRHDPYTWQAVATFGFLYSLINVIAGLRLLHLLHKADMNYSISEQANVRRKLAGWTMVDRGDGPKAFMLSLTLITVSGYAAAHMWIVALLWATSAVLIHYVEKSLSKLHV